MTRISARGLWIVTVVLVLVSARYTAPDILGMPPEASGTKSADLNWRLYADKKRGFELRYPDSLLVISKKGAMITFRHSIPFKHADPCDFDDEVSTLDELVDFHVTMRLWRKGLGETVESTSTGLVISEFLQGDTLKVEPGFIDKVRIGPLEGFRITSGVEGCGTYDYYFPHSGKTTLYVERKHITEFDTVLRNRREYLSIPGIINPETETGIFERMLSTFRILR